jgi:hypothetical protein
MLMRAFGVLTPYRARKSDRPSYQHCLEHPKAQKDGRPDRSKADFTFCLLAIAWGWSVEETADRLMQESEKAQENGEEYASRTARAVKGRDGRRR